MPDLDQTYQVECPHCRKSFKSQPVAGGSARLAGFKCPHCRLLVPFERATETGAAAPEAT